MQIVSHLQVMNDDKERLFALLVLIRLDTFIRINRRDVDGSDDAVHHRYQGLDYGDWSAHDCQKLER